jgi:hypothetical protein
LFIFDFVNRKKIVTTQKLSAILLVAIFSFTYCIKAFHSHDNDLQFSGTGHQIEKSNECPVCEFQPVKDSDHAMAEITLLNPKAQCDAFPFYQSNFTSSIGLSYSDRGPPALS